MPTTDSELRVGALYNSALARIDLGDLDAAAPTLRPSSCRPPSPNPLLFAALDDHGKVMRMQKRHNEAAADMTSLIDAPNRTDRRESCPGCFEPQLRPIGTGTTEALEDCTPSSGSATILAASDRATGAAP